MNDDDDRRQHWECVYGSRPETTVSWYQESADRSLAFIRRATHDRTAPVIDVGGGASVLARSLLDAGYTDVTVLDLAERALDAAKERMGEAAARVHWLVGDVRSAPLPASHYAVWHDRAVFHFLTEPNDRAAYVARLRHALRPTGHAVIATFAEDGPAKCSGLPVVRYSPEALHTELGAGFELVASEHELHRTPGGAAQSFIYCLFRRTGAPS